MEHLLQEHLHEMVIMKHLNFSKKIIEVFLILASLISINACAMDNPDAEDIIGKFEQQEKPFMAKIDNPSNSNRAYLIAYDDYQIFLDKELNNIYKTLLNRLPEAQKSELKISQKYWLSYRDAEFMLIKNNWTRDNFGSSSGISRGQYRSSIIRDRIIQLMHYANNY